MSSADLSARLVAAIQQVRTSTPHAPMCRSLCTDDVFKWAKSLGALATDVTGWTTDLYWAIRRSGELCTCDWAARVDARLAACVEAALVGESVRAFAFDAAETERRVIREAGLAAFLAAAAQERTT